MKKMLLAPYRVLDLTDEESMACGKILADMGSDVIQVEKVGGALARHRGPFYHDTVDPNKSLLFWAYNTNKRSITLDIETAQGKDMFKRLVKGADVVIESFDPAYMDNIGLGYSVLSAIKPSLVMTSISGFGGTGPYAHYKAPDIVAAAMGMIMAVTGEPEDRPFRVSVPQSYVQAAIQAAQGAMVALYHSAGTGEGQHVDVSARDTWIFISLEYLPQWIAARQVLDKPGRGLTIRKGLRMPILWECKDGDVSFLLLGGQPGERNNRLLVEFMDRKGMAPEALKAKDWSQWGIGETAMEEFTYLFKVLGEFFKSQTKKELWEEALKENIMLYRLSDTKDLVEDEQLQGRDFFRIVNHEELDDQVTYPGAFALFSETPIGEWRRPPLIGEHNQEVYEAEMGFTTKDLIDLRAARVI